MNKSALRGQSLPKPVLRSQPFHERTRGREDGEWSQRKSWVGPVVYPALNGEDKALVPAGELSPRQNVLPPLMLLLPIWAFKGLTLGKDSARRRQSCH